MFPDVSVNNLHLSLYIDEGKFNIVNVDAEIGG